MKIRNVKQNTPQERGGGGGREKKENRTQNGRLKSLYSERMFTRAQSIHIKPINQKFPM